MGESKTIEQDASPAPNEMPGHRYCPECNKTDGSPVAGSTPAGSFGSRERGESSANVFRALADIEMAARMLLMIAGTDTSGLDATEAKCVDDLRAALDEYRDLKPENVLKIGDIVSIGHARGVVLPSDSCAMSPEVDVPIVDDFWTGVRAEMEHQIRRWGTTHDARKAPSDWFWLLGYLGGKALAAHLAGDWAKAKHHTISSAAVLAQWHRALTGTAETLKVEHDPSRAAVASLEADRG